MAIWPAECRVVTQKYGNRYAGYAKGYHTGVDIACKRGSRILASHPGTVVYARAAGAYGLQVKIYGGKDARGRRIEYWYNHLSGFAVKAGDKVTAGQTLGYMGNTGNVRGRTGVHVHYEVRVNGVDVDPMPYLSGASNVVTPPNESLPTPDPDIQNVGIPGGDAIAAAANVARWLSDGHNWLRIVTFLTGTTLLIIALLSWEKVSKVIPNG